MAAKTDELAMTLDEKRSALSALEAAYARGVQRVRHNGEEVQYTTGAEMAARITSLKAEIAAASGQASRSRVIYPTVTRGT